MSAKPYSKMIEILRATLQQLEKDAYLMAGDHSIDTLRRSLRRTITALDPSTDAPHWDESSSRQQ